MLALKKLSVKKIATYASVIFVMLCGTGYMLYLNNSLTNKKPLIIDNPSQFTDFVPGPAGPSADSVLGGAGSSLSQTAKNPAIPLAGSSLNASQSKKSGALDINIFSSQKFLELKENVLIIKEPSAAGKRNPFEPN